MSITSTTSRSTSSEPVGLSDVIGFLLRGAPLAIATVCAAAVFAVAFTRTLPPVYEASASLLASRPPASLNSLDIITPPTVDPRVYQRVLLDGDVVHQALQRLEGAARSESEIISFKKNMSVAVENQEISAVIRIDVRDSDPQRAASYANAIADSLIEWDRNRARLLFENSIAALERAIAEIDAELVTIVSGGVTADSQRQQALAATLREQRVRELEAARARGASAVMIGLLENLNRATPPVEAIGPRLVFNTFVAVVLAFLLAYVVQLARWSLSNEVGNRDRLSKLTGLPVLAVFSRRRGGTRSLSGDEVSYFRANLLRGPRNNGDLVVGLTSPNDFRDKLDVALGLAESLTLSGYRTLVVDADLRHKGPGMPLNGGRASGPGLEAYLRDPELPLRAVTVSIDQGGAFDVIPSGAVTRQANELLAYGFERFIRRVQSAYDVVIIDLPPILAYADALVVAQVCTGVVLCTDARRKADLVVESLRLLEGSGSTTLGTVLTGVAKQAARGRNRGRILPRAVANQERVVNPPEPRGANPRAVARVRQKDS